MERLTEAPVTFVFRLAVEGWDQEMRTYVGKVECGKALRRRGGVPGSGPVQFISGNTP